MSLFSALAISLTAVGSAAFFGTLYESLVRTWQRRQRGVHRTGGWWS